MNRSEHLLTCLAEEAAEVAQRTSKALRFGLSEVQPGQPLPNADRILEEIQDLICVALILHSEGIMEFVYPVRLQVEAKRRKIEKFMAISIEQGVLS